MILTTTPFLQGREIVEYLGIVAGEVALRITMQEAMAVIGKALSGERRFAHIEEALRAAREQASEAMAQRAAALNADAVVGIQTDCETVEGVFVAVVSGTAVRLAPAR